jgi:hypothetical protein
MKLVSGVVIVAIAGSSALFGQVTNIFPSSGNVGIGTTNPQSQLHISKAVSGNLGPSLTLDNPGGGTGTSSSLDFVTAPWAQPVSSRIQSADDNNWSHSLRFFTRAPGNPANNLVERMRVTSDGNVGIGTPSPSGLLHVSNGIGFNPSVNATSSILTEGAYGGGVLLKDGAGYLGMWSTGAGTQLNFKAGGSSSGFGGPYGSMVLTSAGNIGIGTTNPLYPLSVNGTIQAKEVRVETGWSDYVFHPAYRLKPLAEVAAYIHENRL